MATLSVNPQNLGKENLTKAFIGGFAGTAVFTLMGMFVAPNGHCQIKV
jgi:hypothetical protein